MPIRKGKLSLAEKLYIEEHIYDDVKAIANKLNRSVQSIQKHLDSLGIPSVLVATSDEQPIESSPPKPVNIVPDAGVNKNYGHTESAGVKRKFVNRFQDFGSGDIELKKEVDREYQHSIRRTGIKREPYVPVAVKCIKCNNIDTISPALAELNKDGYKCNACCTGTRRR